MKTVAAWSVVLVILALALAACGGCARPSVTKPDIGSPNVIALRPPATLSDREKAAFRAGEVVVGQAGCVACRLIGHNGNNGPGPPLTHEGSRRSAAAIAWMLRHPKAPMPSFTGLAHQYPEKFKELVEFIWMLR